MLNEIVVRRLLAWSIRDYRRVLRSGESVHLEMIYWGQCTAYEVALCRPKRSILSIWHEHRMESPAERQARMKIADQAKRAVKEEK